MNNLKFISWSFYWIREITEYNERKKQENNKISLEINEIKNYEIICLMKIVETSLKRWLDIALTTLIREKSKYKYY